MDLFLFGDKVNLWSLCHQQFLPKQKQHKKVGLRICLGLTEKMQTFLPSQDKSEDSFELKAKLEQWRRDGVVIFENAIDCAVIDNLLSRLNRLISDPSGFDLEIDFIGQRKPIKEFSPSELQNHDKLKFNNIHYISPAARALSLSPVVVKFLSHIFQDTPRDADIVL